MKGSALQLAFGVMVLVLGAGIEEVCPKFLGVGFPVLLTAVQVAAASRCSATALVTFAIAAGATEDAICSLPPMTSVSFFLIAAGVTRWLDSVRAAAGLSYPCYQIWLTVWTSGLGGGGFSRLLLSLPIGAITAAVAGSALAWLGRKVALDERE